MFATIILLSLSGTSIVYVVEGKRQCHPCADIRQLRVELGKTNAKIDEVDTTLQKFLAGGGSGGSGGGGGSGSLSEYFPNVFGILKELSH